MRDELSGSRDRRCYERIAMSKLDEIERRIDSNRFDLEEYADDLDWLLERVRKLETALTRIVDGDYRLEDDYADTIAREALKED